MDKQGFSFLIFLIVTLVSMGCSSQEDYTKYVNRFIGSGVHGKVIPAAVVPFGMVQSGPNTREADVGYRYFDKAVKGFSLFNKGGSGCTDFHDILFVPLNGSRWDVNNTLYPEEGFPTEYSHEQESASPGYYQLTLDSLKTEITATSRCAMHRYTYNGAGMNHLAIDLKHGSIGACTIVKEDSYDTVFISGIRIIDDYSIEGYRISNGWAQEQHVYFYAEFSKPFDFIEGFLNREKCALDTAIRGTDVRSILSFDFTGGQELLVKVGISPNSCEGARLNLETEIPDWDFNRVRNEASQAWNKELSKFRIKTNDPQKRELFYTSVYNVSVYPMLYSDVDGKFRGPDFQVHQGDGFRYFGGVIGLWDTFRGAIPLQNLVSPGVMTDYYKTFMAHYNIFGQLPIYGLAGTETFCMIGVPAIAVMADWQLKKLRGFDSESAYDAMKVSIMRDTIGFSMRYFQGFINYKKYGYVPADLEAEATAKTLEYSYYDWCMAQASKDLGKEEDYQYFMKRSKSYRNVFDKSVGFMNGRFSNGGFRPGLDPFFSNHRRDDFCEGNAWQWTFFVPHDVLGLADLIGGKKQFTVKLDSLFSVTSNISGSGASGDISGLIGQYAHGNEPSHHIAYMYNYVGEPWKTQRLVHQILTTLYNNTEDNGICGDEDTGQMSAWYVFSSMGFYPMNPSSQKYDIGSPLLDEAVMKLGNGKDFTVKALNLSDTNIYVQAAKLNGKPLERPYVLYDEIIKGGKLEFIMGNIPSSLWGKN